MLYIYWDINGDISTYRKNKTTKRSCSLIIRRRQKIHCRKTNRRTNRTLSLFNSSTTNKVADSNTNRLLLYFGIHIDRNVFFTKFKKQHGIRVKGRWPSMLKPTMKVAAGTSVEICFAAEASLTWGVWNLDH